VYWQAPPKSWPLGATVVDRHLVQTPVGLAPGEYRLDLGLYDATHQQFVPLMNDDGTQRYEAFQAPVTVTQ
jgi:hypothetical protein